MKIKAKTSKLWTPDFFRLVIWQILVFNGFTMVTSTFSDFLVEKFSATPFQVGIISSVLIIGAMVLRPVAGLLLDRFGRRRTLLLALVAMILFDLMLLIPKTLFTLGVLRFLMGFPFALITTGNSALRTDIIPEDRRMDGFSITSIATMFSGLVTGPNIGYFILSFTGFNFLYPMAAVLLSAAALFFLTMKFEDIRTDKISFSVRGLFEPKIILIAMVLGINFIGWPGILNFGPLYAQEIGLPFKGYLFTAYGVGLLLSRPIIKFLQRDGMPLFTNALGVMATLTGNAIIGFVPGPVGFLTGLVFLGLGYGQCFAVLQKLAFDLVKPERRGRASGTIYISQDMGSTTGRYLLGYTAQMLGTYTANYRIVAGITLIPLLILLFVTLPDYRNKMASTANSSLK